MMGEKKMFPIMGSPKGCPNEIPWSALNEEWAQRNHSQSLARLAERGGLDVKEAFCNINKIHWSSAVRFKEAVDLVKKVKG